MRKESTSAIALLVALLLPAVSRGQQAAQPGENGVKAALEIPTPRWTAYDAKRFRIKMGPEVPMTTTERAYTSPIWYTP